MAMKTSHVLLLCLMFVIGFVEARISDTGPDISTPPSGSCGASIAEFNSSQILAKRAPPCRRPRLQNSEDVTHTTLP
ncbi:hypothetical protein AtNW77_Chr5g0118261 [Arabidopsis thaliana]|uniref:Transmembrane protein n=3 Tax=Arabidopsis TaxID=3701 RepID=A0A178UMB6_ARATH|nr:hypothetical protein ISN45_At05g031210 [Arabidopsis thaliana x Arabidopsis arenosa]KAG7610949.1 hypothetical protein ISN44_As05g030670 [Arabidopsis suecica]OAO94893.1 hypothetical protein AXX17_AT5G33830 [Arabidopsis thaliana]CAA0405792.1 unnamed protein product [Arabidopsis thaliana]VYS68439.1 unnamed protein product [Arabidopsis thaliana]